MCLEDNVIIFAALKWRVEIYEIHGRVMYVLTENVEVVAVV
jgi:hypothetical protein